MSDGKITCRSNGPFRVEGNFILVDQDGNSFDLAGRTTLSLCRCGASEDKPLCDGAHRKIGFQSEIKARVLPPANPKP